MNDAADQETSVTATSLIARPKSPGTACRSLASPVHSGTGESSSSTNKYVSGRCPCRLPSSADPILHRRPTSSLSLPESMPPSWSPSVSALTRRRTINRSKARVLLCSFEPEGCCAAALVSRLRATGTGRRPAYNVTTMRSAFYDLKRDAKLLEPSRATLKSCEGLALDLPLVVRSGPCIDFAACVLRTRKAQQQHFHPLERHLATRSALSRPPEHSRRTSRPAHRSSRAA